jgi:protease-4
MPIAKLQAVAQGRVWTGRQAKQVGLVDELGGVERALAVAKQRAGLLPSDEVEIVSYPPRRTVFDFLSDSLSSEARAELALGALLAPEERRMLGVLTAPARIFRPGEVLAMMPLGIFTR